VWIEGTEEDLLAKQASGSKEKSSYDEGLNSREEVKLRNIE